MNPRLIDKTSRTQYCGSFSRLLPVTEPVHEEPYTIKCICDHRDGDGNTIYCKPAIRGNTSSAIILVESVMALERNLFTSVLIANRDHSTESMRPSDSGNKD